MHACREGRPGARAELFDRFVGHVQRVLLRVMGPDPELADLVQDVFVAALDGLHTLRDERALSSWLTRVTVFRAKERIRRRQRWRFVRLLPFDELPEVHAASPSEEVGEALRSTYDILSSMNADDRIVFALRFIQGMELVDVADACGVSLATVKRRLVRAQKRFVDKARGRPALAEWLEGGTRWKR